MTHYSNMISSSIEQRSYECFKRYNLKIKVDFNKSVLSLVFSHQMRNKFLIAVNLKSFLYFEHKNVFENLLMS